MTTRFNWLLCIAAIFATAALAEDPLTRPEAMFLSCAGGGGTINDMNYVNPGTYLVGNSDGKLLTWTLYQKSGQTWSKVTSGSSAREEHTQVYLTYQGYTDDIESYLMEVGRDPGPPSFVAFSNVLIGTRPRFELTCFFVGANQIGVCQHFGLPVEGPVGAHGFVLTLSPSLADTTAQDQAIASIRASRFVKSVSRLPDVTGQPARYQVATTQSEITTELQQEVLGQWCKASGVDRIDDAPDVSP